MMSDVYMILGFALAAYSIVANDSIQTLGTFLSSNSKRPWWILWLWIATILVVTVLWGWAANHGDPSFGRLTGKIDHPASFNWLYVIPPLVLVILTNRGIPVSTSLLVLTAFSSLTAMQMGESGDKPGDIFLKMMQKSLVGYVLAFGVGLIAYGIIVSTLEKRFADDDAGRDFPHPAWFVFQWLSTGFLWSMWLVQDLANVFVYLDRNLAFWQLALSLSGMVILLAILIKNRGGKIQQVVVEKTNTVDLRSATFIDFFYGLVLLFFKVDYIPKLFQSMGWDIPWPMKMPMSTTWVFLGLLAGREVGMWLRLRHSESGTLTRMILRDLRKVTLGAVVSLLVAFGLPWFAFATGMIRPASAPSEEDVAPSVDVTIPPIAGDSSAVDVTIPPADTEPAP